MQVNKMEFNRETQDIGGLNMMLVMKNFNIKYLTE